MWNFNSRTGTEPDYITDTKNLNLSGDYAIDTFTVSRNNEDVSINYFGHQLLKLCIATKLRILNYLIVEQGVTSKVISLTLVFEGLVQ